MLLCARSPGRRRETRRQGDKETRRQGDKSYGVGGGPVLALFLLVSSSPCLLVYMFHSRPPAGRVAAPAARAARATHRKCHAAFSTSSGLTVRCSSNCLAPSSYRPA